MIKEILNEAERRLDEAIKQNELGADNKNDIIYWRGYRDALRRVVNGRPQNIHE